METCPVQWGRLFGVRETASESYCHSAKRVSRPSGAGTYPYFPRTSLSNAENSTSSISRYSTRMERSESCRTLHNSRSPPRHPPRPPEPPPPLRPARDPAADLGLGRVFHAVSIGKQEADFLRSLGETDTGDIHRVRAQRAVAGAAGTVTSAPANDQERERNPVPHRGQQPTGPPFASRP